MVVADGVVRDVVDVAVVDVAAVVDVVVVVAAGVVVAAAVVVVAVAMAASHFVFLHQFIPDAEW